MQRILWLVLVLGVAATGCAASVVSSTDETTTSIDPAPATPESTDPADLSTTPESPPSPTDAAGVRSTPDPSTETASKEATGPSADPEPTSDLDAFGTELPPAPIGIEALAQQRPTAPRPVSLAIEDIDVVGADVIPVGVNPDLTFEVPPADQVGWYRFGPAPGEEGSAVLAAHIAFDGVDGVFRHLADAEVGAVVTIGFDDGSSEQYRIESITEFLKDELPDELFAREGSPQIALITCGGDFNRQLSSYESNIVAVAVPV